MSRSVEQEYCDISITKTTTRAAQNVFHGSPREPTETDIDVESMFRPGYKLWLQDRTP